MTSTSSTGLQRALRALALNSALCLALSLGVGSAMAKEAPSASADPALEARMMAMAAELRCLVCQNQTIADSHADLALDLRQQIREMLAKGQTDREIMDYMTQRYGDFVLYRPPFKATTALLWMGPAALMVFALGALVVVLRRRQRLGDDAFDPDDGVPPVDGGQAPGR
jgi:cytochrome c-type biogenesis protein CcmH